MKNIISYLALLFFLSCQSNPTNSNTEELLFNPEISITKNESDVEIIIYDYPDINGFQFDLIKNGDIDITSLEASLGLAEEYGFYITTSIQNLRVLGFSLTETNIPALSMESSVLIKLQLDYSEGTGEIGLGNVILSGENGMEIDVLTIPDTISIP